MPVKNKWPETKQNPIEGFSHCLNCSTRPRIMDLRTPLAIGFGDIQVTMDDEMVWCGDDEHVWLRRFENRALKDPDHDWRVTVNGPLYDCEYQRHGNGEWVLIHRGLGFA